MACPTSPVVAPPRRRINYRQRNERQTAEAKPFGHAKKRDLHFSSNRMSTPQVSKFGGLDAVEHRLPYKVTQQVRACRDCYCAAECLKDQVRRPTNISGSKLSEKYSTNTRSTIPAKVPGAQSPHIRRCSEPPQAPEGRKGGCPPVTAAPAPPSAPDEPSRGCRLAGRTGPTSDG